MQQFHHKNFKQQQTVIKGCLFEPKERKKKSKFVILHMKKLWLIDSKECDMDLLTSLTLSLSHWLHLGEKGEVVKK